MTTLEAQLAALPADFQNMLAECGFNAARLIELAKPLQNGVAADNLVKGILTPPTASDVVQLPAPGTTEHARLTALGEASLRRGEYALVVLAGGMATRMGGVVKALVDAVPGKTLLRVTLHEGRKRIVRRMLDQVGFPVESLVRTNIGAVTLGEQRPGSIRALTRKEVGDLYKAVGM